MNDGDDTSSIPLELDPAALARGSCEAERPRSPVRSRGRVLPRPCRPPGHDGWRLAPQCYGHVGPGTIQAKDGRDPAWAAGNNAERRLPGVLKWKRAGIAAL